MLERLEVTAVRAVQPDAEDDDEIIEDEERLEPDPEPDEDY
jgi:hypothetical protein